jgi:hypothetical protein
MKGKGRKMDDLLLLAALDDTLMGSVPDDLLDVPQDILDSAAEEHRNAPRNAFFGLFEAV